MKTNRGIDAITIVAVLAASLCWCGPAQGQIKPPPIDPNIIITKPIVSIVATDDRTSETLLQVAIPQLGIAKPKGTFTVTRTAGTLGFAGSLTVSYSVSGTATPGSDYGTLPGTVTIPPGASSVTIDVNPVDTGFNPERDETVIVTLTSSSSYGVGSPSSATVTIIDNDQAVIVAAFDAQAAEGGDIGQFKFSRLGSESGQLVLNYSVSGTATPGVDYTALPGSVTLPNGVTQVTVNVTPISDNQLEGDETVTVTLGSAIGTPAVEPRAVTVTIADTAVTVSASQASMTEVEGNTANFIITRTGGKGQALTVPFTISGTATNGSDYNTITSPAVIPAGAASVNVAVVAKSDPVEKGAETVVLTLSPGTQYALGSPNSSTIVIEDNVPPRVSTLTLSPATVIGGTSATGTVTLTGPAAAGGLVVTLSSNSAAAALPSSLSVAAGQTSATFSISTAPVASNAAVTITVTAPTGNPATQTLTVQAPALSTFTLNKTNVTPQSLSDTSSVTGTVSISGPAASGGVVVNLSSNNSGVASVPASVTVPANQSSVGFPVTTIPVAANASATITAARGAVSQTQTLAVKAPTVASLTFNPATVVGSDVNNISGTPSTGTFVLDGAVPVASLAVQFSSGNSAVTINEPSVVLPGGTTQGTMSVRATPVTVQTVASITATLSGASRAGTLTVVPPSPTQLTLDKASIIGGATNVQGTIHLNGRAPSASFSLPVSSNSPAAFPCAFPNPISSVTFTNGFISQNFNICTEAVASDTLVTLTAGSGAQAVSAQLQVRSSAVNVSSLVLAAVIVNGGAGVNGTVTLAAPALTGGSRVTFSDDSAAATSPQPVTIAEGQTSSPFTIATSRVATDTLVTVTATPGNVTQTFTIRAPVLDSVTVSPVQIQAGGNVSGTVTLSLPAPSGNMVVQLSSNNPAATVPSLVTVVAGQSSAGFQITTTAVAVDTPVTITASLNNNQRTTTLTVLQPVSVSSLALSPSTVPCGNSSTATVTLSAAAPTGGLLLTLSSQNPKATVPVNITVTAGQTTATFAVSTIVFGSNVTSAGNITATAGGVSRTAPLQIQPIEVSSLTFAGNAQAIGGGTSTGVVFINRPAPGTGIPITLSSPNAVATVPSSVTIPAGQTFANFSVSTVPVATNTAVTLQASFEQSFRNATLTVLAPNVDLLTLSPTSVHGGNIAIATVRLNGAAPTGGLPVTLVTSNSAVAPVPQNFVVPAGQTQADFNVTTAAVATNTTVTLQASRPGGNPPVSATLTVTP